MTSGYGAQAHPGWCTSGCRNCLFDNCVPICQIRYPVTIYIREAYIFHITFPLRRREIHNYCSTTAVVGNIVDNAIFLPHPVKRTTGVTFAFIGFYVKKWRKGKNIFPMCHFLFCHFSYFPSPTPSPCHRHRIVVQNSPELGHQYWATASFVHLSLTCSHCSLFCCGHSFSGSPTP